MPVAKVACVGDIITQYSIDYIEVGVIELSPLRKYLVLQ
jgi:hypothetical protein